MSQTPPSPPYLPFWGKAQPDADAAPKWHPLAYHSLDVAAVAKRLLQLRAGQTKRVAAQVGVEMEPLARLSLFLIALHDLGKFSRSFQALAGEEIYWPAAQLGPYEKIPGAAHWQLSNDMMLAQHSKLRAAQLLSPAFRLRLNALLPAVAGHHGKPPDGADAPISEIVCNTCIEAAQTFMQDLKQLLQPPDRLPLDDEAARALSFWLAGLTVTADWLGSNREVFAYRNPHFSLAEYWRRFALPGAEEMIGRSGLSPSQPAPDASLRSLFAIDAPRPMQAAMSEIDLPDGPALFIIEDATGSGKTEAATLLAQRLMRADKASGLYFALPSMATANGMFGRMQDCYRNLFTGEQRPSLALAHGRASEHDGFRQMSLPTDMRADIQQREGAERDTAAECAAWIADDRRKTFFAEIGVGTIDQAILGVLPSKFQALRLWGLCDRVLIVDEAHAYDAYMTKELETLLTFHAALGGSAIVLSATLPAAKRTQLTDAFRRGLLAQADAEDLPGKAYPLVTIASRERVRENDHIAAAAESRRTVAVERLASTGEALRRIEEAAGQGAAVAYICNAVDDAISAHAALGDRHPHVELFHARYAMGDRQRIEQAAVRRFGKQETPKQRTGHILVATQVIEQSLDLDFDLIVSDLAPIDLLIQRAGRLWRHMDLRPADGRPIGGPKLCVVSPDPDRVEDRNWLESLDQTGRFVYKNHALLWRTARLLFEKGEIRTPDGLRELIEIAYTPELDQDGNAIGTPVVLHSSDHDAYGEEIADKTLAGMNLIELEDGYAKYDRWFNAEEGGEVFTRLGEKTRIVRLARVEGEALVPYIDNDDMVRAWTLSEVAIRQRWLEDADIAARWQPQIEAIRQRWPKFQRHMLIAPVDAAGYLLLDGLPQPLIYDRVTGLRTDGDSS